jgi:hypothetical protein
LTQKSEESINDYTYRVQMAYKRLTDKKPATMAAVRNTIAALATEAEVKAERISDAFKFIKHQLFLAGLKDGILDKVLEAAKDTFTESVKVACNLETIQNDHKRLNKINAIKNNMEEERAKVIVWDNLSDDQLAQLAAICFGRNNRYNNNGNNGNNCNNQNNNSRPTQLRNPNTECRYCKKKGHVQKDCFSRKQYQAQWLTPTASRTSKTTASTTLLISPPPPKLPRMPAMKTPLSGQSLILALTII